MPLNGHSYLVAQGWTGHGKGLREGSISRPLAIPQKRTLAGLGKDRDEAFPFWDHLFNAAAKSIQVKVFNDDDDSNTDNDGTPSLPGLHRTSTGLISNRRPNFTSASSSGAATTLNASTQTEGLKLSLLATAKREAAKRGLYARFFRGPVLGPDTKELDVEVQVSAIASASMVAQVTSPITNKEEDGRPETPERKKGKAREETGVKKTSKGEKRKSEKEKKKRDKSKEKGKGKATEDPAVEDIRNEEIEDDGKKRRTKHKDRGEKSSEGDDSVQGGIAKDERKRKRQREKGGDTGGHLTESREVPSKDRKKRARLLEENDTEVNVERRKEKEDRKRRKEEKRKRRESKSG